MDGWKQKERNKEKKSGGKKKEIKKEGKNTNKTIQNKTNKNSKEIFLYNYNTFKSERKKFKITSCNPQMLAGEPISLSIVIKLQKWGY